MGGRGGLSASAYRRYQAAKAAGTYTGKVSDFEKSERKSLDDLIDSDGHIPLGTHPVDYTGYSQDEVERFFADREYEVSGVFSPDGRLVVNDSQWKPGQVSYSTTAISSAIKQDGSGNGDGYTDFHNHPLERGTYTIFSGVDLKSFSKLIDWRDWGRATPDKFAVLAEDGSRYELRYVGGGKREHTNLARAFNTQLNKVRQEVRKKYPVLPVHLRDKYTYEVNGEMDKYLKKVAGMYGFEYTSNIASFEDYQKAVNS